ncbi:MAG TPA: carboxypeptidase regulatory-like domain-containing protein [Terriglobia bacterium]|nr:carboxypeptidase regulatory-like domain-containing protein [Terriglobia bacterium]
MKSGTGRHVEGRIRLWPAWSGFDATLCLAACTLVSLATPPPLAAQTRRSVTVHGTVRTDQGAVLKSVSVRLESGSGEPAAATTTSTSGEFSFEAPAGADYVLIANADGLEPYRETVDLGEGPDTYEITIVMNPLRKAMEVKAAPPALSDAQAPKEARRDYERAQKAITERKWGPARKELEAAVGQYPCYARAQTDLGMLLSQQKDYQGSETALRKSISCDAGYVDAYLALGELLNAENRFADAQAVLEQGLRQEPASWQFYYQMGAAQYGQKHYDLAEQQYLKAKSMNQDPLPEMDAKLADVYLRENDYPKAYASMQDYLSAEPSGRFAARIKDIMKQMESAGVLKPQAGESASASKQP